MMPKMDGFTLQDKIELPLQNFFHHKINSHVYIKFFVLERMCKFVWTVVLFDHFSLLCDSVTNQGFDSTKQAV